MKSLELMKESLADVCIRIEGRIEQTGVTASVYTMKFHLSDEEAARMRRVHPKKPYKAWVDLVHPETQREVTLPFGESPVWYGDKPVIEDAFRECCREVLETIVEHEQDLTSYGTLIRAESAARYVRKGFTLRPEQRSAYDAVAETRELPPLALLTRVAAEDAERTVNGETKELSGKTVRIPSLSFFSKFHRDGVLLFNLQHDSYLTGLRDGFREELRQYVNSEFASD